MINVIKHGKREKEVQVSVYCISCLNCDCEFEFTEDEALSLAEHKTLHEQAPIGSVICPDCGYRNTFCLNDKCRTETLVLPIPMYDKEESKC